MQRKRLWDFSPTLKLCGTTQFRYYLWLACVIAPQPWEYEVEQRSWIDGDALGLMAGVGWLPSERRR